MAEAFFAAAWATGVLEGGSILLHANKQATTGNKRSTPLLLVPSLLYGTAALPLGIIGASPGSSLVGKFPFAPPVSAFEEKRIVSLTTRPTSSSVHQDDKRSSAVKAEDETLLTSTDGDDKHDHHILSRSEMIRKVREDNKRFLAEKQLKHHRPHSAANAPTHPPVPDAEAQSKPVRRKWIATLDGRPLTTPLAEAMRRTRFLCIGAGLVMAMATFEKSRQEELEREETLQSKLRREGRDVAAIQSLVNKSKGNGVALRLVDPRESWQSCTDMSKGPVVPLVHQADSTVDVNVSDSTSDNGSVYWKLGTTPQEWMKMPLTTEWLFPANNGRRHLILEANVSSSSILSKLMSFLDHHKLSQLENVVLVPRILGTIARQKGVLDDDTSITTVLIGSGPLSDFGLRQSERNTDIIYIDGAACVGTRVLSRVEEVYSQGTDGRKISETKEESTTSPKSESTEADNRFSMFEYVGMKLREGGTYIAAAVASVFACGEGKMVVCVVSDNPLTGPWLRQIMPYEWKVRWYDAFDEIDAYLESIDESKAVVFVHCGNDETTCATVCSLLTKEKAALRPLMVLVESESSAASLRTVATELNSKTQVEILSVQNIHNSLFDNARGLLASGKTPAEVQTSIQ